MTLLSILATLATLSASVWVAVVLSIGAGIAAMIKLIRRRLALAPTPARVRTRKLYPDRRRRRR